MSLVPDRPPAANTRSSGQFPRAPAGNPLAPRRLFLAAGLGFLLFIVYGSLVPFDFHPRPLDATWLAFQKIPWLILGIDSRADWVANILLYIPFGFCFTGALGAPRLHRGGVSLGAGVAVFLLGAILAVGVEFTQMFFPPRTVSLNDIIAEILGTAAGIGLWWAAGEKFSRLLGAVSFGGPLALRAAITIYLLGYLALSLFPFDFVLGAAELRGKIDSGLYSVFLVRSACGGLLLCSVKLGAEIAAVVPLGLLMGMMLGSRAAIPYAKVLTAGCVLGAVIEAGQFFIASGVSQGISVLTRGLGFVLGVAILRAASPERMLAAHGYLRPAVLIAVAPYLGLLLALNGWFDSRWTGPDRALELLAQVSFIPFYYHYYTTESAALQSLLRVAAAYVPIGIGYGVWRAGAMRDVSGTGWVPAALAGVLAVVVETGKLFVPEKRPDPTDVLIAAFAAYAGYAVAAAVQRRAAQIPRKTHAGLQPTTPVDRVQATDEPPLVGGAWSLLILIAVSALLLLHPFGLLVAAFLAAYAAFLWRWPRAALPAVLALLPVLNFSPWTGWILVDEFDLAAAVTVALWLLRRPAEVGPDAPRERIGWVIGLLAGSFSISAVVGLLPLQTFDQGVLTSYYGTTNSLHVAKGFAWALALLPMLRAEMRHAERAKRHLVTGMVLGLCGVVAVAVWQRIAMAGLLDFATDYRIAATFPETHTGGGDVEAYLVMAIPFALAWIALSPNAARIALGTALFAAASYALAVTFARAGYLAYPVVLLVMGIAVAVRWLRQRSGKFAGLATVVVVVLVATAVVVPVMDASFMQSRFTAVRDDAEFRSRHWAEAIDMMDTGVKTALFGMGLGSFPRSYLLRNRAGAVPATFAYLREGDNRFVRLGSGVALYFDQRIAATAGEAYTLSLDLRSLEPRAALSVSLCEKTEQHSFQCKAMGFAVRTPGEKWSHEQLAFNSGQVGAAPWFLRPPVVLSLVNPTAGTRIDVDNVSLLDSAGRELIANGDFSSDGAHWFFTTDNHAQWHIFNLWVHVFFEQGWLGVLALAAAVGMALTRLGVRLWQGDLFSAMLLASLCGVLVVGLFNSLLDGPRVAALFFLLLFAALTLPRDRVASVKPR